jgi:hypothetical protein
MEYERSYNRPSRRQSILIVLLCAGIGMLLILLAFLQCVI